MTELTNLLSTFIQSTESNLQLDFYSRNQIILQIYKLNDVKNWNYGIENYISYDLVVELTFNKNKIENKENKQRLLKSEIYSDFIKIDTVETDSYWSGINKKLSINLVYLRIQDIINTVYDLKDEPVEHSLTAY